MKAIHVIYVSPVIDKIMFVVKPFLRKALLDILHFHTVKDGDMKEFYSAVPRELLPPEIGGTMPKSHKDLVEETRRRVERNRDWLVEEERLVIDESKRPDDKRDTYSVAGSFRKLQLDWAYTSDTSKTSEPLQLGQGSCRNIFLKTTEFKNYLEIFKEETIKNCK